LLHNQITNQSGSLAWSSAIRFAPAGKAFFRQLIHNQLPTHAKNRLVVRAFALGQQFFEILTSEKHFRNLISIQEPINNQSVYLFICQSLAASLQNNGYLISFGVIRPNQRTNHPRWAGLFADTQAPSEPFQLVTIGRLGLLFGPVCLAHRLEGATHDHFHPSWFPLGGKHHLGT
jgi:hypothetical protein